MKHSLRPTALTVVAVTGFLAAGLISGCTGRSLESHAAASGGENSRLRVAATTDIVGDVVARIGGQDIDLTVLIDPGQDPHGYEPTTRQISTLSAMDIVFVSGFGLEEGLLDVVAEAASGPVVEVSSGITPRMIQEGAEDGDREGDDHEAGGFDPHTWMSPVNVVTWAQNIAQALAAADPPNAAQYRENAAAYVERLKELDTWAREALDVIPRERRNLVTDHQVFGYFADEYGFRQVGFVVPGSSTNAEATPRELAALVELIRREGVTAIFVGESASPRLVQLADSIAGEAGNVSVLPVLTGSLARPGEFGDNYLDYIAFNVRQIVEGLGQEQEEP